MSTRIMIFLSIFLVLLIPAISAKPVIIGLNEKIDQKLIKEHNIANYTQYKIINAISTDIPDSVSKQLKKNPIIKYIEEDAQVQITGKPIQPPQLPQQMTWGITRVKAPGAGTIPQVKT